MAIYATYLTNKFGFMLKKVSTSKEKKHIRILYAQTLLDALNINVVVTNPEALPSDGQFFLISNHRSVIDPLIVELATQHNPIFGHWISKKELYNSFFFGTFIRNGGTILIDREASQMNSFFKDIKSKVAQGDSIYVFPEGTRTKGDTALGDFQGGTRLMALKNRLPILPVYIKTNANTVLNNALSDKNIKQTIEVHIGTIISYRDKNDLQEQYKQQFNIS